LGERQGEESQKRGTSQRYGDKGNERTLRSEKEKAVEQEAEEEGGGERVEGGGRRASVTAKKLIAIKYE
jgi:hypothetical protein